MFSDQRQAGLAVPCLEGVKVFIFEIQHNQIGGLWGILNDQDLISKARNHDFP